MTSNTTVRPTIAVLTRYLEDGWEDIEDQRKAKDQKWNGLFPFRKIGHPIIRKSAEALENPASMGQIKAVTSLTLYRVRIGNYRGALWLDSENDVYWIVYVGIAKGGGGGGHDDYDDVYSQLGRMEKIESLLPTDIDKEIFKEEKSTLSMFSWEENIQENVLNKISYLKDHVGEKVNFVIPHDADIDEKDIKISFCMDYVYKDRPQEGYCIDLWVESALASKRMSDDTLWDILVTVTGMTYPDHMLWNPVHDDEAESSGSLHYVAFIEEDELNNQISLLKKANADKDILLFAENDVSHWVDKDKKMMSIYDGEAMQALCGYIFVSSKNENKFPVCTDCQSKYDELSE